MIQVGFEPLSAHIPAFHQSDQSPTPLSHGCRQWQPTFFNGFINLAYYNTIPPIQAEPGSLTVTYIPRPTRLLASLATQRLVIAYYTRSQPPKGGLGSIAIYTIPGSLSLILECRCRLSRHYVQSTEYQCRYTV